MKKILVLLTAVLVAVPLFAQDAKQIKKKLKHIGYSIEYTNEGVMAAFEKFKTEVAQKNYYDYGFNFQSMDQVRVEYMKLHKLGSISLRALTATLINSPVSIANGQGEITISQYINMESINLISSEAEKFETFRAALEEDLRLAKTIAEQRGESMMVRPQMNISAEGMEGALRIMNNVKRASQSITEKPYPQNGGDTKAISDITQIIVDNMMDDYNNLRKVDMEAAHAVGAYIANERFTTKDGHTFQVVNFIQMFAGNVPSFLGQGEHSSQPSMYDLLDDFKDHLREDAALAANR